MINNIKISSISKHFGKTKVLDNIRLEVPKGSIYALLGLNGAGKTTLFKVILGLLHQDSGEISADLKSTNVGCIIETPTFYDFMSGFSNLECHSKLLDNCSKENIKNVMDIVGLDYNDKKKVKRYSLGMRQRLGIARALLNNPEILILDEPINGLDPAGVYEVRSLLRQLNEDKKITILISSHIINEVENIATDYGIIHKGKIISQFKSDELRENVKCLALNLSNKNSDQIILDAKEAKINFDAVRLKSEIKIFGTEVSLQKMLEIIKGNQDEDQLKWCGYSVEEYFLALTGGAKNVYN